MGMAYIATNPVTKQCYAICSADPDFIADAAEEMAQWKKDGAVIELLPKDEAVRRFAEDINPSPDQIALFNDHIAGPK